MPSGEREPLACVFTLYPGALYQGYIDAIEEALGMPVETRFLDAVTLAGDQAMHDLFTRYTDFAFVVLPETSALLLAQLVILFMGKTGALPSLVEAHKTRQANMVVDHIYRFKKEEE